MFGFVPSTKCHEDIDYHIQGANKRLGINLNVKSEDFFIIMEESFEPDSDRENYFDYSIANISSNDEIQISYIPAIPILGDYGDSEWLDFNDGLIRKQQDKVKSLCKKKVISESVVASADTFISNDYLSLEKINFGRCYSGNLYLIKVNSNGEKKCFHMISPSCIKPYLNNQFSFYDEYFELYKKIRNVLFEEMENCRWSNFVKKKDIPKKFEVRYDMLIKERQWK